MQPTNQWDAEHYQARHSYVWQYGEGLIDLLAPQPHEKILDLGCGTGQLTARIAASGASVLGIDRSPEMIAQAKQNFPDIPFRVADATTFELDQPVDAVFSNAVLHWVKDADAAAARVFAALKPSGRFVVELGGHGNTRTLLAAIREVAGAVELPWYYPSVAEYAGVLEREGFEVRFATLFDRPTRAEGEDGLEDWLAMFAGSFLGSTARREVVERLRHSMYFEGGWTIDYRRLRVVAVRPAC